MTSGELLLAMRAPPSDLEATIWLGFWGFQLGEGHCALEVSIIHLWASLEAEGLQYLYFNTYLGIDDFNCICQRIAQVKIWIGFENCQA